MERCMLCALCGSRNRPMRPKAPAADSDGSQQAGRCSATDESQGHVQCTAEIVKSTKARKRVHDAAEQQQQDEVFKDLPAHAAVLASNSGYWKARLLRWRECIATTPAAATAAVAATATATEPAPPENVQADRAQGVQMVIEEGIEDATATGTPPATKKAKVELLTPAATAVATTGCARAAGCESAAMLEQVDSAEGLEAACSTLQHAYTHKLPAEATFILLMQMAVCADRWDMPQTVEACLNQAAKVDNLTVDDINALLKDEMPSTIKAHDGFKMLVSNITAALLKLFGRAQAVVTQPEVLEQFCNLSLNAVQLWAQQDNVKVDSENTVAVLFTHWWDRNCSSLDDQHTAAAQTALTESLRVGGLTASFLSFVVWELPWFRPVPDAAAAIKILHGTKLYEQKELVRSLLPVGWTKTARALDNEQDTSTEWVVTKAQLDQLHKDAGQGKATLLLDTTLYWSGYRWQAGFYLADQKSVLCFGIKYLSAMPQSAHAAGYPPLLPATFQLVVSKPAGQGECSCIFGRTWPMIASLICNDASFLGVPASSEPRANSYPPDSLWKDGKLHLQVKMKEIW